jgi:hypothetical protein
VGYTNTGSAWISVKDGTGISFTDSGTAASTYGKDNSTLQSAGYIDSTGNLVAAYDAATAHLGAHWRMPTDAEFSALISKCTITWTTTNGVYGWLVTGKDAYADKSIFLPAAGEGDVASLYAAGAEGNYWFSTSDSGVSSYASCLYFNSSGFSRYVNHRYYGQSVRPVWPVIDLSTLTDAYTAQDGDVLTGTTEYEVSIPGGAHVTINGVAVTGTGGGSAPAPTFAEDDASEVVKFAQAEGGKWTITAFAELANDAMGADVADGQIKVYSADTLEELKSATTPAAGAAVKEKKSAVKATVEVPAPSGKNSQFFKVKFGE